MQPLAEHLGPQLDIASRRIRSGLPSGMSGPVKTQHLGVYLAILLLTKNGETADTTRIAEFCNMSTAHTSVMCNRLTALGVLTRTVGRAPHGKGRLYQYVPVEDIAQLYATLSQPVTEAPPKPKATP